MQKIAIYPGSFDPITNGHLDIIRRSRLLLDKIIIAVNDNPSKTFLFTVKERTEMIKGAIPASPGIEVESFRGLLVRYAEKKGARFIIRGLRALSDFEYEFQMDLMNRKLSPGIETIFLMTSQKYSYLSSSIIKEIVQLKGCSEGLIPEIVREKLLEKFKNNF
ncbi:pantetheine-phosphate adenylyltransferase [Candidatus Aerophobetes bacterium]|nr:pantetheine-phosphate adenylyltransferase [Candidatus Aerophobetes bacterium]